jgi:hypothetical protein
VRFGRHAARHQRPDFRRHDHRVDQQQAAESIRPCRGSEHHGMPAHRVPDAEHALQPQAVDDAAHVLTEVQPVVGRRLASARTMAGHVQREDVLARQRLHHGLPAARVKTGGVYQQDGVALAGPLVDHASARPFTASLCRIGCPVKAWSATTAPVLPAFIRA